MDETQTGMWEEERDDAFLGNMHESGDGADPEDSGDDQEEACEA